jgi:hypothetical protein
MGYTMIRGYPPHFCNLAPRQNYSFIYSNWFIQNDETMWAFGGRVEKKVWETYYSRNHYVLK